MLLALRRAVDGSSEPGWPNLFVAGPPRTATTSLHRYLGQHPEIHMAPVKEPEYFGSAWDRNEDDPEQMAAKTEAYRALFEGAAEPVRGEVSISYLINPRTPERILDRCGPEVRVVIPLRDPIERAHSHWLFNRREHGEDRAFDRAVRDDLDGPGYDETRSVRGHYVRLGCYRDPVRRYRDVLGPDRVRVVLFEDLRSDLVGFLKEIAAFLDVDPAPMERFEQAHRYKQYGVPRNAVAAWLRESPTVKAVARAVLPRDVRDWLGNEALLSNPSKPPVPDRTRELLEGIYEPDVTGLEELLDRDLPELRKTWGSP